MLGDLAFILYINNNTLLSKLGSVFRDFEWVITIIRSGPHDWAGQELSDQSLEAVFENFVPGAPKRPQ